MSVDGTKHSSLFLNIRHFLHWLVQFESVRATLRGKGLEIRF